MNNIVKEKKTRPPPPAPRFVRWSMLIDETKSQLGMLLNLAIPKAIGAFKEALAELDKEEIMAEQLDKIYRIIEERTGFKGRFRLVVKTGVSRTGAASMPDDPEMVEKFKIAANDILGYDINEFLARR